MEQHDDPLIDTVINGRYRVIRMLGEGGMSAVYEVEHIKLKRQFALKRLLPSLFDNVEALIRFEREAALLASLRHPNVVDITDWDQLPDLSPFMVLEFLHGASVRVRMDRGPLPWEAIARIGDQTMAALALAHRTGITHRDLKPENIFISIDDSGDERVKLLDFGVSKMRGLGRTTAQHAMLGTPSYMSPEQAQGLTDDIGPSSDVWSVGAILYEMATHRVAFTGESLVQTVISITSGRPEPMTKLRPDAPPAFVELVDRAIDPDPARRITTIEELRARLRAALEPRQVQRLNTPLAGVPIMPFMPSQPIQGSQPIPATQLPKPAAAVALQKSQPPGMPLDPPIDSARQAAGRTFNFWIIGATAVLSIAAVLLALLLL